MNPTPTPTPNNPPVTTPVTQVLVNTKQLSDTLNRVNRVIDGTRREDYKLFHFHVSENAITIAGQSDTNQLSIRIPADTTNTSSGSSVFAVPSGRLAEAVRTIAAERTTLELHEKQLHLHAGTYHSYFTIADNDALPPVEFPEETTDSGLTGEDIQAMMNHTTYIVETEVHNPVFQAVKLHFTEQYTRAVTTDGFRLAYWNAPATAAFQGKNALLPSGDAEHVLRNFTEGPIRINAGASTITLETDTTKFRARTESGEYPAYERIIPSSYISVIEVNAPELIHSAKRLYTFAKTAANNRMDLNMNDEGTSVTITSEGQAGSGTDTIDVKLINGETPPMISINAKYLIEALTPIEGKATISISGQTTPMAIEATEHNDYFALIVPLRNN